MEQVMGGAKEGGMTPVFYDLNEKGIRGCQHCYYCRSHEGCAVEDPLSSMYEEIKRADAILFGAPIYFYQISGQSKIWLDRMFPMFTTPQLQPRYPGKTAITIFSQGYEDSNLYQNVIREMNAHFELWGWDVVETILKTGSEKPSAQMLEFAYLSGKRLAERKNK